MSRRKLASPKRLAGLMAAVSATALMALPASAQTPPAPEGALEIVIITANQREENLQDVAISATALPTDQLETIFSGGEDVLALLAAAHGDSPTPPLPCGEGVGG